MENLIRARAPGVPRGSYPTPFLRYLIFHRTDPNHKTRYPQEGVGYDPLGRVQGYCKGSGLRGFGGLGFEP